MQIFYDNEIFPNSSHNKFLDIVMITNFIGENIFKKLQIRSTLFSL